ncbi:Rho GTPase activating protein 39 [Tritrichomonas musculus]|uniref:Rho GTPase activating protein 39 n=1 Tax=Tritrichomonas musculus TaxID=1915356 RepID=A0ABR2L616_9EUKA
MIGDSGNNIMEEYYEDYAFFEEEDKTSYIPLPPTNIIMPQFISDDSGTFIPPFLNSIDFSDLDNKENNNSADLSPTKFPIFNMNDVYYPNSKNTDSNALKHASSTPNIKNNPSNLTIPSIPVKQNSDNQKSISVNRYFEEEYAIAFGLPANSTKDRILAKINQYSIHSYAKTNFRKHHHQSFNMKYLTTDELTSFSDKPLYKMLLKKVPDEKKEVGGVISTIILRYAKVLECDNIDNLPVSLVSTLRENNDLIDETFFQLIKYSTNCPDRSILAQVWKLWIILGSLFPISDDAQPYIFSFLIRIAYKCKDPLGDVPRSQSTSSFHESKTLPSSEYESNNNAKEINPSSNSFYQDDLTFINFAKFVFLRMFERSCKIGLIYTKDLPKEAFMNMPKVVRFGRSMFSCSLYEIMFCQKRLLPVLPIPLPLHLIIKQIKKNGGLFTPEFFVSKNRPESRSIVNTWIEKLPFNNSIIEDGEINELVGLLFYFLFNISDPLIPKLSADMFIEKCQSNHHIDILNKLPSLHANTIKYLIGFLQEVNSYQQYNLMSKEQIAEIFSKFFVETHKKTIEPFKRHTMNELCNGFIINCIEKLDCTDVYPLNPELERRAVFKKKPPEGPEAADTKTTQNDQGNMIKEQNNQSNMINEQNNQSNITKEQKDQNKDKKNKDKDKDKSKKKSRRNSDKHKK